MELRDPELFERKIYAKQFQAAVFRSELRRLKSGDVIALGTATDAYQPAERRFQVTRRMLEAIADARELEIGITTKSDLVARDAALMNEINRRNRIRVHVTVTTLDERLARLLEPRAPRPALRLQAVKFLADAGIRVTVQAHPVMPLINDSEASLDSVCEAAAKHGASSFSAAPLFLKPCSYRVFLPFLEQHFPHLVRRYRERFDKSPFLRGHYPEMLAERVEKIRARHGMTRRQEPEWPGTPFERDQMELFALYNVK
jgi:DNA repair photolyase